jgi:glycosyltransferase involved in cell wall biosynthesis
MKILFLSQYYPPESNAPANRVSSLARYWASWGDEVTVLTGYPHHPEGRVYPGYRANWPRWETDGGVSVLRVPIYATPNAGVLKRSATYASFCLSASWVGALLARRADVVVATSPQFLTAVAGAVHALVKRRPFVMEVRDLWPESIVAVGALPAGHPVVRGLSVVEERLYRLARRIVVVTPAFRTKLLERGIPDAKLRVIPNGLDTELFRPADADEPDPYPGKFVVAFAGTVGMAHGLETLLEAATRLLHERPEVLFVIAGDGAERGRLEQRARSEGLTNVRFLGRIPRDQVPPLLRRADVNLVMLRDSPLFKTVIPSKIFESMGCARPILLGVDGQTREIVEAAGAGVFFQPGDAGELGARLLELVDQPDRLRAMGESGRAFALEHYRREDLARRYREVLSEVVSEGAASERG